MIYNTKNRNIRNWMFVFVYSSYHLKLSFPHLVVILTTLEILKNIFCSNNNIMQNDNEARICGHYHESSGCFEYPKKSLLKSSHPKKYLPNFATQKKSRNQKFQTQKNPFDHPRHLKSGVPPPPPLPEILAFHEKIASVQIWGNKGLFVCEAFLLGLQKVSLLRGTWLHEWVD